MSARFITLLVAAAAILTWYSPPAAEGLVLNVDRHTTLEDARDAVRKLKRTSGLPQGGVTVEIAGGRV